MPLDWAMIQNNLGILYRTIGERLEGEAGLEVLCLAEASYRAALEVFTCETMPSYWRNSTSSLDRVQRLIAERGG